jgi:hypothetical protein|tara:strand:+ start:508 stop:921 length:414 start_codon:yes stop_codon:yes gene_type:complete
MAPFIYYKIKIGKWPVSTVIVGILTATEISSLLFWSNPKLYRNTVIHHLDSCLTRITISIIVLHNMLYQPYNIGFFASTFAMFVFFYYSNAASSKKWCSNRHLGYHLIAHIMVILSSFFTVFPFEYDAIQRQTDIII